MCVWNRLFRVQSNLFLHLAAEVLQLPSAGSKVGGAIIGQLIWRDWQCFCKNIASHIQDYTQKCISALFHLPFTYLSYPQLVHTFRLDIAVFVEMVESREVRDFVNAIDGVLTLPELGQVANFFITRHFPASIRWQAM